MNNQIVEDNKTNCLASKLLLQISLISKKYQTNKEDLKLAKSNKLTLKENKSYNDICNICFENFKFPITLLCNHRFCGACLNDWFSYSQVCPVCKKSICQSN